MRSREKQQIVIVDENDNFIGEEEKEKCHDGNGILHRGFLVMVFNKTGELLLTQRSERKKLWPGFWDGTIASHVVKGEDYIQASKRRLAQEIGLITNNVKYLFKFRYYIRYKNIGAENEICGVTMVDGIDTDKIFPDSKEISDIKFISTRVLIDDFRKNENKYTPWLILAVGHMNKRQTL
jgi:isopentenyl-diphosphate delta-isomerase